MKMIGSEWETDIVAEQIYIKNRVVTALTSDKKLQAIFSGVIICAAALLALVICASLLLL